MRLLYIATQLINFFFSTYELYKSDRQRTGWVANLLDNKFSVANYFAIEQGINYFSPEENYQRGVAIAAAVTSTDMKVTIGLIGIDDAGFTV